jgi:hypothetical protein
MTTENQIKQKKEMVLNEKKNEKHKVLSEER